MDYPDFVESTGYGSGKDMSSMNEQEYNAAREEILRQWDEEIMKIPQDDVIPRTFNDAFYNEPYRKLERKYIPMLKALEEEYRNGLS